MNKTQTKKIKFKKRKWQRPNYKITCVVWKNEKDRDEAVNFSVAYSNKKQKYWSLSNMMITLMRKLMNGEIDLE
jgi:hypothetical protein